MADKFSLQDLNNAQDVLCELFEEVSSEEGTLAGGSKLGTGGNALQGLLETRVTFGNPTNDLIRLTQRLFDDVKVELTEIRKRQMRDQFDFYYMTLTVSMQPKRGAQFTRVECRLDFGPKGEGEPIVQSIFPKSEWKEVFNLGGGMNLALDGNLEWGAELVMPDVSLIKNFPDQIRAKIFNKNEFKAVIAVPDYSYKLWRTEIAATGEGNSECFWRIEKPDLQKAQTVQFGVVFKVPKDMTFIELTGRVAAEPNINWLVTNLRDVFGELSGRLQHLFRLRDNERSGKDRLPIGDHEKWIIPLRD